MTKLTLQERFKLNRTKQLRRLDELDNELDEEGLPKLASQDQKYIALRREYDDLEREFDQRHLRQFGSQSVAIYGGEGGKTVTSIAAVAGLRPPKKKAKAKAKPKRRFRI
ncbi:MAG: hypothetical protein WC565_06860, partial [Parcubacteria group bacterium]|jgi:hypothetical protein